LPTSTAGCAVNVCGGGLVAAVCAHPSATVTGRMVKCDMKLPFFWSASKLAVPKDEAYDGVGHVWNATSRWREFAHRVR
jgi:hypothetical protein